MTCTCGHFLEDHWNSGPTKGCNVTHPEFRNFYDNYGTLRQQQYDVVCDCPYYDEGEKPQCRLI